MQRFESLECNFIKLQLKILSFEFIVKSRPKITFEHILCIGKREYENLLFR